MGFQLIAIKGALDLLLFDLMSLPLLDVPPPIMEWLFADLVWRAAWYVVHFMASLGVTNSSFSGFAFFIAGWLVVIEHESGNLLWYGKRGKKELFWGVLSSGGAVGRIKLTRYIASADCDVELLTCFIDLFKHFVDSFVAASSCPPLFDDPGIVSEDFDSPPPAFGMSEGRHQEEETNGFCLANVSALVLPPQLHVEVWFWLQNSLLHWFT